MRALRDSGLLAVAAARRPCRRAYVQLRRIGAVQQAAGRQHHRQVAPAHSRQWCFLDDVGGDPSAGAVSYWLYRWESRRRATARESRYWKKRKVFTSVSAAMSGTKENGALFWQPWFRIWSRISSKSTPFGLPPRHYLRKVLLATWLTGEVVLS
jgi:hypothetical protein